MVPELENYLMWTMGVGITLQAWGQSARTYAHLPVRGCCKEQC